MSLTPGSVGLRAVDLEKSVEKGVLVAAGVLGAATCSLVLRELVADEASANSVRESLRHLS
jgi:hypothetical protein